MPPTTPVLHVMGTVVTARHPRPVDGTDAPWSSGCSRGSARSTTGSAPGSRTARSAASHAASYTTPQLSTDLREVLDACEQVRVLSAGSSTSARHRPDGQPDPTGLVKGWSVDRAVTMLEAAGVARLQRQRGGRRGRPWTTRSRAGRGVSASSIRSIRDRVAGVVSGHATSRSPRRARTSAASTSATPGRVSLPRAW